LITEALWIKRSTSKDFADLTEKKEKARKSKNNAKRKEKKCLGGKNQSHSMVN
jgi:hypothetical protein